MWTTSAIGLILAGYLLGSLSPSFLAARALKGIDLRRHGSGNVGSSNIGIQLGRAWTIAIGVIDLLKGFLPSTLARVWGFDWGIVALAGIAAVIGHDWSLYLGFTGGRGMATMIGALCAWDARLVIALLCVIAIGWRMKQSAIGSMVALILLAPSAWILRDPPEIIWGCALIALIIALKRLEANRLPLPREARAKRSVLWRRLWMDRDVPHDQAWEERGEFNEPM